MATAKATAMDARRSQLQFAGQLKFLSCGEFVVPKQFALKMANFALEESKQPLPPQQLCLLHIAFSFFFFGWFLFCDLLCAWISLFGFRFPTAIALPLAWQKVSSMHSKIKTQDLPLSTLPLLQRASSGPAATAAAAAAAPILLATLNRVSFCSLTVSTFFFFVFRLLTFYFAIDIL